MFIGHFALGLAAKRLEPKVSLGTYFLAVQFADLLWPTLLLLGMEEVEISPGITAVTPLDFTSYPISHSLLSIFCWGAAFGLVSWLVKKNTKGAVILGLCVVSHWVLDLVMHRPDLPLFPGDSPLFGFGVWNSIIGSQIVELSFFFFCVWLYTKHTKAIDKRGIYGFWTLVVFFMVIHVSNLMGPPPPNVMAIAIVGQLQWLFVIWAYWLDGHRAYIKS